MKTYIHTETRAQMFTATVFVVAKQEKQLKRPSADEWTSKTVYVHTTEYYSAIKRNQWELPWRRSGG